MKPGRRRLVPTLSAVLVGLLTISPTALAGESEAESGGNPKNTVVLSLVVVYTLIAGWGLGATLLTDSSRLRVVTIATGCAVGATIAIGFLLG